MTKEEYENKKQKALANFIARATAHFDTPVLRKQAKEMFENNYPPYEIYIPK